MSKWMQLLNSYTPSDSATKATKPPNPYENEEYEERIAIMMHEGGLTEEEAITIATKEFYDEN